ncbi:sterol desaturase family protein [Flammeovirga yaeyamensis]|uniref:Sterol desaturase family protein n=1 Tax=Flammeovirga yaeyamensis TaxID=367791 RepID=A0AAX1NB25_9BACT|nr:MULTISPECIES: sterol desaturase family protein [Flammeovirga]ANQ52420.1 sterol desaturase family protein [Flammeovirga sp. MY04]MBB3699890.1 sterol desaturase/sphingolipid hydroxylase (fatty acid hydroxylase superfamily) [Flammeovirga yaeyamensis]NMF38314.1 sterol desaturase family protein [Flammeovirga yaeyamensis]QWG04726.1 sterol desaturase family protein [Flammeovirga yaeyamensis]
MTLSNYLAELSQDQLLYFSLPIFFIAIIIEVKVAKEKYNRKDTSVSLLMMLFAGIIEFIPKLIAFIVFIYLHEISPLKDIIQRQWWAWLLLFFCEDLSYYFFHRLNHEIRLFWAGHVTHHSSEYLNFGTALRQGVGERIHKYFFWLWLPLLGFDPLMIFTMMGLSLFYQFWVHTELIDKLPKWFEYFFNTPSHHRVHHASNIRYLDRNHAGVLIIWDRFFGTYAEELKEIDPPVYGLTENINTFNKFKVVTHEYQNLWRDIKSADRFTDKLRYLFKAPGWSHLGDDKRAKTLRRQLSEDQEKSKIIL